MIKLSNVSRGFGKKIVIDNFSYDFPDSGFFVISGPNGSGKTTLLCVLGLFDSHYKGSYALEGKNICFLTSKDKLEKRRKLFSYVLPKGNLISFLDVGNNINLLQQKKIDNYLYKIDAKRSINGLSGGEEILISLNREVELRKKVLLLDEVTYSLDDKNTSLILNILKEYSENHLVIMASHDQRVLNCSWVTDVINIKRW